MRQGSPSIKKVPVNIKKKRGTLSQSIFGSPIALVGLGAAAVLLLLFLRRR